MRSSYLRDHAQIEHFHDGFYAVPQWLTPWTISACNVDAALAIVAQDWAAAEFLAKPPDGRLRELGYAEKSDTNRNLHILLQAAFALPLADVYATNAFPFVKEGPMNAGIPLRDLVRAVKEYALPEIETVHPRLAICVGARTFNAFRRALGHAAVTERDLRERPMHVDHQGIKIGGVPHCGRIVTRRLGMMEMTRVWRRYAGQF